MQRKSLKILTVEGKKYIVLENEAFDWEVEPEQVRVIEIKIKNDPAMKESLIGSLFNHFTSCFSEFVGKKMSLKDINDSLERGYIE